MGFDSLDSGKGKSPGSQESVVRVEALGNLDAESDEAGLGRFGRAWTAVVF